jgi:hypothetical protein
MNMDHFKNRNHNGERAYASATEQCRSWGYKDAQEPSNAQTECKKRDRRGDCTQFFTYADYKCNLTNEIILYQQKQNREQEIRDQVEKQEKEQEEIELAKKRENALTEYSRQYNAEVTRMKELCPKYRIARQICASAGSYSKCMEIKLELSNRSIVSMLMFSTENYLNQIDYLCNN